MPSLMFYPRQTDYIAKLNELAAQAGGGGTWPGGGTGGLGIAPNYYGVLDFVPTTRLDGSASHVGDRYFNVNRGIEYTWNGAEWYEAQLYWLDDETHVAYIGTCKELTKGLSYNEVLCGLEDNAGTMTPLVVSGFGWNNTGTLVISAQAGTKHHYSEYRFSTNSIRTVEGEESIRPVELYPVGTNLGDPLFTMDGENNWYTLTLTPTQIYTNIQVRIAYMSKAALHSGG